MSYDPETGRFINVDAYVSTGQGLSGNNMFAYCNGDPINNVDPSGNIVVRTLIKYAVKATIYGILNASTSWVAAKVTGQKFGVLDGIVSFAVGAASQIPIVGAYVSGTIAGMYTYGTSLMNGATHEEAAFNATTTFVTTSVSVSGMANSGNKNLLNEGADYIVDAVFMTANNTLAATTNVCVNAIADSRKKQPEISDPQIICLTYTAYGYLPY